MNIPIKKIQQLNTPIVALLQLTGFCGLLMIISTVHSSNFTYFYLGWNLFLAWVPLIFAKIWSSRLQQKPLKKWKSIVMFGLWLLFFPNSPYLITDLVHLNTRFNDSIWSDTLIYFSFAFAGLVIGLYSLHLVHKILTAHFDRLKSWIVVLTSIALTGFGIYLGRVQRWNSWDLFTNPFNLMGDVFLQLTNPQAIRMTLGFSALLFVVYYLLRSVISHEKSQK